MPDLLGELANCPKTRSASIYDAQPDDEGVVLEGHRSELGRADRLCHGNASASRFAG
jgi:hypothetical protein